MVIEFRKICGINELGALVKDSDWDNFFLALSTVIAIKSTCVRRRYGIVVAKDKMIVGHGYNGNYDGKHRDCCKEGTCLRDEAGLDDDAYLEPCLREEFSITEDNNNFEGCTMYISSYNKRTKEFIPITVSVDWIYKLSKLGLSKIIFGIPKDIDQSTISEIHEI